MKEAARKLEEALDNYDDEDGYGRSRVVECAHALLAEIKNAKLQMALERDTTINILEFLKIRDDISYNGYCQMFDLIHQMASVLYFAEEKKDE